MKKPLQPKPTQKQKPVVHGILYVHGAGMPEDKSKLVGDPLSEIANGLIDAFYADRPQEEGDQALHERYRLAVKAECEERAGQRSLTGLTLDIFRKGTPEEHAYELRMREVLWRPDLRSLDLSYYLPIIWIWAMGFRSFDQSERNGETPKHWYLTLWNLVHRNRDLVMRLSIALVGLVSTVIINLLFLPIADLVHRIALEFDSSKCVKDPGFLCQFDANWWGTVVATPTILFSFLAMLILFALGCLELWERQKRRHHSKWHNLAMIAATSWLAIFVAPLLIILYYVRQIIKFLMVLLVIVAPLVVAEVILAGSCPMPANIFGLAKWCWPAVNWFQFLGVNIPWWSFYETLWFALWILVVSFVGDAWGWLKDHAPQSVVNAGRRVKGRIVSVRTQTKEWGAEKFPEDDASGEGLYGRFHTWSVVSLTQLLVATGAPLVYCLIKILTFLSVIPFLGDSFKKMTDSIPGSGYWRIVQDVQTCLTDSTRAALVRYDIEHKINELGKIKNIKAIHVLAHSFGTVASYDTLAHMGRGNTSLTPTETPVPVNELVEKIKTYVTFGSPLEKIRKMTEATKKALREGERDAPLSTLDCTRFEKGVALPRSIKCWLNFYSVHDYISDALKSYKEEKVSPEDIVCQRADNIATAHGEYWKDADFWEKILEKMDIVADELPKNRKRRRANLSGTAA